jgi:hypothetical protein
MGAPKMYDERAVVLAYIDAQRPPYPHEDFRLFRQARLEALQRAYRISISMDGVTDPSARSLWILFSAAVDSYLGLRSPRDGFLEDSLINGTIDGLGESGSHLRQVEAKLHSHLRECRDASIEMLIQLFIVLWGRIEQPVSSADLRTLTFDDSKEPRLSDYYDEM